MEKMSLFWVTMLCSTLFLSTGHCKPKSVSVNLNSKWGSTPLVLEASEYLVKFGDDVFWEFVNSLAELEEGSYDKDNERHMYELMLKIASGLITPLQMGLLKFSLSMRAQSPTIEMYNTIAREIRPAADCETFVDIHGELTCSPEEVAEMVKSTINSVKPRPMVIKSDHHYPGSKDAPVTVILYGEMGSSTFRGFHNILRSLAEKGEIDYILRHFMQSTTDIPVRLSGYGVELAIKNQEYKAKDDTKVENKDAGDDEEDEEEEDVQGFLFKQLKTMYPDLENNLDQYKDHLIQSSSELAPLKVWQLQDLSFQAASRVLAAEKDKRLQVLRDISQNFPIMARALTKEQVSDEMKKEVQKNQKYFESKFGVMPGESAMFINGLQADLDVYDVFTLLETLRSEAKLMEGLHSLGIQGEHLAALLKLDLRDSDTNYAVDIRDDSVIYINNLEKDIRYSNWPSSVQDLLRPTFPGMLRHVKKNMFHLVFMVDPTDPNSKDLLKMAEAFYVHSAPIRVGVVFLVNQEEEADADKDAGVAMARAFYYMSRDDAVRALSFVTDVYEKVKGRDITSQDIINEFLDEYPDVRPKDVFGTSKTYDKWRKDCGAFFTKVGLQEAPQVLVNGAPLAKDELNLDTFEEAVVSGILKKTPELQKAVYQGQLTDRVNILDFMMTRSNVMPRLNPRVLAPAGHHLDFTKDSAPSVIKNVEAFSSLPTIEMSAAMRKSLKYISKKDEPSFYAISSWLVADLETEDGRTFVYNAVKALRQGPEVRLAVIHNPTTLPQKDDMKSHWLSRAFQAALQQGVKAFATKLLKKENIEDLQSGDKKLEDLAASGQDFAEYQKILDGLDNSFLYVHKVFCERALEIQAGQRAIVTNGKVIGPFAADEPFLTEDFVLLEKYTWKVSAEKVKSKVKAMGMDDSERNKDFSLDSASDMVMRISSLLLSVPQSESRKEVEYHSDEHSVLKVEPRNAKSPAYDVVAILDPTTRAAQKYTPLLMVLQNATNANIRLYFNCREQLSEMPLKSFYRYVLEPEVSFMVDDRLSAGPGARFHGMPQKPLLTLGMDPPESWLVQAVNSPYDLDNIYLDEIDSNVHADFELEYLLLEGHCFDSMSGQPPRGLQFVLGTNSSPAQVDTIVMANLGYFQLKASPRAWMLNLRHGRSNDIYQITSHENTDSFPDAEDVIVTIDSFKSKILKIRVSKKLGKENEDLLGENEENGGIWNSISKKFGGTDSEKDKHEVINIFSLASGHLYERFLRIMMLSVLKNTKSKVKFWFLKNYLSPIFKDFIPNMAKEYNFDYELVQYKWPRWLHQQTEKQRIIWGYKILFLDVLFPLDVQKIIFVDADQIVRTDLKELMEFDLEGAPYGYTPFCDSRREMEGFRFWKSGYWASHLGHRKYHISALYVVDLKKFRKIAAGDRLRGQYQGLSQDPNSLSNLDQDLPNNMIHQVGIKSLPQEWLWCETWCDDASLKTAKTIDLCNNPKTKEPKLSAAMRIVPEWNGYDSEIKSLWDRVYNKKSSSAKEPSDSSSSTSEDKHTEL